MRIESNIGQVVERFRKFEANVPALAQSTLEHQKWTEKAQQLAMEALHELAETEAEREAVGHFVAAVKTAAFGRGMSWSVAKVAHRVTNVVQGVLQDANQFGGMFSLANAGQAKEVGELVEEWARTEKRLADGETPDEATKNILYILFGRSTPGKDRAIEKLLPHLRKFAEEKARFGLTEERIGQWLEAILETWRQYLVDVLPDRMRQALRRGYYFGLPKE